MATDQRDLVAEFQEISRRDDCFDIMVPSDVRMLIGEIVSLRAERASLDLTAALEAQNAHGLKTEADRDRLAAVVKKCADAGSFYLACKADPETAGRTLAYRDAHEWVRDACIEAAEAASAGEGVGDG